MSQSTLLQQMPSQQPVFVPLHSCFKVFVFALAVSLMLSFVSCFVQEQRSIGQEQQGQ